MKYIYLHFAIIFSIAANGYDFQYKNYDWDQVRKPTVLSGNEIDEPALILKELKVIEFVNSSSGVSRYDVVHKIIRVNSDRAIEEFNKIYIPISPGAEILDLKVRAINRDGKITNINKENIKEVKNLEDYGNFKIFVVEGVERGGEIEYLYKIMRTGNLFGREIFQSSYNNKNLSFKIIFPQALTYETKSYNGFPTLKDSTIGEGLIVKYASNIVVPAKLKEEFSNYKNNLMKLEYVVRHRSGMEAFPSSWEKMGAKVYQELHNNQEYVNNRKIDKLYDELGITSIPLEEDRIRVIERYIKNNFVIKEGKGIENDDINFILKVKTASGLGMTKLFVLLLEKAGVNYQLVLTCNKEDLSFDPDFCSWEFLRAYLIYFPGLDKFLTPTEENYRYPLIPYYYTYNYGLFVKRKSLNSAVGEARFIPAISDTLTNNNLNVDVKFNIEQGDVLMDISSALSGYRAITPQYIYSHTGDEEKMKRTEHFLKTFAEDGTISDIKIENTNLDVSTFKKPFIIKGKLTSSSLLQKSGSKYIFSVGMIIGKQSNLYEEKERISDIDFYYKNSYKRHIEIHIPDGYSAFNLESIKKEAYISEQNASCGFISNYKIEGNMLVIDIVEYYRNVFFPVKYYEAFRRVINASADFNNVKIVFEKNK